MKKLTSLILALAMCLALGIPAFAAETTQTGNLSTELTSLMPTLTMTLPETATIILNPYRMKVADSAAGTGIDKGDRFQVMNTVFSVESKSDSKVHVSATVTGAVSGNAAFATADVAPGATGHDVYLTLTHKLADVASDKAAIPPVEKDAAGKVTNVLVISDAEQTLSWDMPAWAGGTAKQQRIDMIFGGTCSDSPTAEEGPWTDSDTVSCSIVFEVTPITDIPMVAVTYQSDSTTNPALEIPTSKPSDYKATAAVTAISVNGTAIDLTNATGLSWNGEKVVIPSSVTNMGTEAGVKKVIVTLTYDTGKKTLQYEAKVTVLAPATT